MQFELKEKDKLSRRYQVTVPETDLAHALEHASKDFQRQAAVPGFRPGKAPKALVESRFRKEIRAHAVDEHVQEWVVDVLKETKDKPATEPHLHHLEKDAPGGGVTFELHYEVQPEVALGDYKGLKLEVPRMNVGSTEVDGFIERMRKRKAVLKAVEGRASQKGDVLRVDLLLNERNGEAVAPPAEGDADVIGGERVLAPPEEGETNPFYDVGIGMNVGDTRSLNHTFPDDYPKEEFRGAQCRFDVTLKEIHESILPALDDDFAKDMGEDNLAGLRASVSARLDGMRRDAERNARESAALQSLLNLCAFDVPRKLVEAEARSRVEDFARRIVEQGIRLETANLDWSELLGAKMAEAERAVRIMYALEHIAEKENIAVEEADWDHEAERMSEGNSELAAKAKAHLKNPKVREQREDGLRRQKALEFILSHASITEVDAPAPKA